LSVSARARYSSIFFPISCFDFSFFSSKVAILSRQQRAEEPAQTFESEHEVVERVLVLLISFGVVLFYIFVDRALNYLDGPLDKRVRGEGHDGWLLTSRLVIVRTCLPLLGSEDQPKQEINVAVGLWPRPWT
jgi:hypothetical protein